MLEVNIQTIRKAVDEVAFLGSQEIFVNNVEFDSRKITPGSLFIPLTGGATDGHSYIDQAIENGAVATLWSRPLEEAPQEELAVIQVEDTLLAMQDLAAAYRQRINPVVIGITGSNGKTTTKDMTAQVLIAKYKVHKTQGNYNNEIGLPYTILQMPEDTDVIVLEMGMSNFGEIELLSQIAQPDLAAITLIGESHLEFLSSRAGIAKAKMEIVSGLRPDGTLFCPGDEPLLDEPLSQLDEGIECLRFGFDESYDIYAYHLIEEKDRTYFRTNLDDNVLCMIPVLGAYNVSNALIALGIAKKLGVPIEQAIFQLSQFELTENRLQWLQTPKGTRLLNDAYNASPTSMRAVLQAFARIKLEEADRKVAVLGDMLELGPESKASHQALAEGLQPDEINLVYLYGNEMEYLYEVLKDRYDSDHLFHIKEDQATLLARLQEDLQPKDVVLFKSSFGMHLLKVVEALVADK